jgi:hypothetical protein
MKDFNCLTGIKGIYSMESKKEVEINKKDIMGVMHVFTLSLPLC